MLTGPTYSSVTGKRASHWHCPKVKPWTTSSGSTYGARTFRYVDAKSCSGLFFVTWVQKWLSLYHQRRRKSHHYIHETTSRARFFFLSPQLHVFLHFCLNFLDSKISWTLRNSWIFSIISQSLNNWTSIGILMLFEAFFCGESVKNICTDFIIPLWKN